MADISAFLRRPLSKLMIGLALVLEVTGLVTFITTGNRILGVGLMVAGILVNVLSVYRIRAWRAAQPYPAAGGPTPAPPERT